MSRTSIYSLAAVIAALLLPPVTLRSADANHDAAHHARSKKHESSVEQGQDGRLIYRPDALGNVIPDFSNCGYRGGGVALPDPKDVPVRATVHASGGEDGPSIQAAIDGVSKLPPAADGIRGAVLLKRGVYHIAGAIAISHGGVVLRGEGEGKDGTTLIATGTGKRSLITIGGKGGKKPSAADEDDESSGVPAEAAHSPAHSRKITDDYVPVGAHSFSVDDAAGFKMGDHVLVHRPSTAEWIHVLGMDSIPPRKDGGKSVQWAAGSKNLSFDRIITAIAGKKITLDAPLANALDSRYGGGTLSPFSGAEPIAEAGIENLRGISEFDGATDENHAWTFIQLEHLKEGYVRNITAEHFGNTAVAIGTGSKWITVQDCACLDPISKITGGRRYSFSMNGCSLCLVQRCTARNGRHDFVMGSCVPGPNVFLDCRATKTHADIGPHHRWSVGVLWDNIDAPHGEINIRNRGNMGSGHGWAGANQVAWNCTAKEMIVENPPTAQNWAIGCKAQHKGDGIWKSVGHAVLPRSLYLAQLQERLGPQAVANANGRL